MWFQDWELERIDNSNMTVKIVLVVPKTSGEIKCAIRALWLPEGSSKLHKLVLQTEILLENFSLLPNKYSNMFWWRICKTIVDVYFNSFQCIPIPVETAVKI